MSPIKIKAAEIRLPAVLLTYDEMSLSKCELKVMLCLQTYLINKA
jgi:hypothetical protein